MSQKRNSAYQVGLLRDIYDQKKDQEDIFTLTIKAAYFAKQIKERYDPVEDIKSHNLSYGFEESSSSVSSALALSKAVSELLIQEEGQEEGVDS